MYKASIQGKTLCAVIKRPSYEDIKAYAFLQNNQIDSALICFNNYLLKDSSNTSVLNMVSNIYMQTDRMAEAERYINRSYKIDSSSMETKQMKGILCIQQRDFANAQILFHKSSAKVHNMPKPIFT